jgi:hypothetical protein
MVYSSVGWVGWLVETFLIKKIWGCKIGLSSVYGLFVCRCAERMLWTMKVLDLVLWINFIFLSYLEWTKVNKVIRKVRKSRHRNPVFGHIQDEIFKNSEKKGTLRLNGAQEGLNLRLGPHLLLIWVRPVPFFSWAPSTNHCCCYVYCIYKCSQASCI